MTTTYTIMETMKALLARARIAFPETGDISGLPKRCGGGMNPPCVEYTPNSAKRPSERLSAILVTQCAQILSGVVVSFRRLYNPVVRCHVGKTGGFVFAERAVTFLWGGKMSPVSLFTHAATHSYS